MGPRSHVEGAGPVSADCAGVVLWMWSCRRKEEAVVRRGLDRAAGRRKTGRAATFWRGQGDSSAGQIRSRANKVHAPAESEAMFMPQLTHGFEDEPPTELFRRFPGDTKWSDSSQTQYI